MGDHSSLTSDQGLFALVRDPFDNVISEQALPENEGRIAFSSEHAGDHRVCFGINNNNNNNNPRDYKMEIHIDSGEHAHDYDKLARVEHLSTIEVELRRLNDKIRAIRNEQQYQKQREEEFRDTSENTNWKVVVRSVKPLSWSYADCSKYGISNNSLPQKSSFKLFSISLFVGLFIYLSINSVVHFHLSARRKV